jgi:DnaK suppressor protein
LLQIKAHAMALTRIARTLLCARLPMTVFAASALPTKQLAAKLHQREAELRALLQHHAGAAVGATDNPPEVLDFKDVAAEDTRALIDEVALNHATGELRQVVAALRRVADGSYGLCQDCGEPIDERRLFAMPATAFCTACQAIQERPPMPRR